MELGVAPVQIGRTEDNDVILDDETKAVSRAHAELRYDRGRYIITDLKSRNGIAVNDVRVRSAVVYPDTRVTIGPYRLMVVDQTGTDSSGGFRMPGPAELAPTIALTKGMSGVVSASVASPPQPATVMNQPASGPAPAPTVINE